MATIEVSTPVRTFTYTSIHSMVTQTDITRASDADKTQRGSSIPNGVPNGVPNGAAVGPHKRQLRSKYKHIHAPHDTIRTSVLSHDSIESASFVGFRNLLVLTTSTCHGTEQRRRALH